MEPLSISVGDYVTVERYRCGNIQVLLPAEPLAPDDMLKIDMENMEAEEISFHSVKNVFVTEEPTS